MRKKRSLYNFITQFLFKAIQMSFGLILPRLFIMTFGSATNGLISAIDSIIAYIAVLEMGIGMVSLQALYDPINRKDHRRINEILSATEKYFRRVGFIVLFCVLALATLYPLVKDTGIDYWTVVFVVILCGSTTILDFFVQSKYRILLNADAKGYVLNLMATLVLIVANIAKIILIYCGFNVIVIQLSFSLVNLAKILLVKLYVHKNYPYINEKTEPDYSALSERKYAFVHQITTVLFNNVDAVIIAAMYDLKMVSVYTLYKMIFSNIVVITSSISLGVRETFGQLYQENKERFKKLYHSFAVYYTAILFAIYATAYLLCIPFITLYTQGIEDVNYIVRGLPLLFVLCEFFNTMRILESNVSTWAGHFRQTQVPAIVEAVMNLVLSVIFAFFMGINGVILATILAIQYRLISLTVYTNRNLLNQSPMVSFKRWGINLAAGAIVIFAASNLLPPILSYGMFIICGFVLVSVLLVLFLAVNIACDHAAFNTAVSFLKEILNGRKKQKSR